MKFGRLLRLALYHFHSLIAHKESATRAYIGALSAITRMIPAPKFRKLVKVAILHQHLPWQPLEFAARDVIVGSGTPIKLYPHLGEFDSGALFDRHLDYEYGVFSWLELTASHRYDAVIEIGANVGVYSVFFDALSKRNGGRPVRTYAFEPSPQAFRRLLANVDVNAASTIEPLGIAVSHRTEFSQFFEPEGHLTNGSLLPEFASIFSQNVRQRTVASMAGSLLETLFVRHERVLVKIDAEGFEPQILSAMEPIISRFKPDLIIEVLHGVEEELRSLACLSHYNLYLLRAEGPSRREKLTADPVDRDFLLTAVPLDL